MSHNGLKISMDNNLVRKFDMQVEVIEKLSKSHVLNLSLNKILETEKNESYDDIMDKSLKEKE